ncbi:hypothetical protein LZ554_006872 [Drepanopeziza brunnea f. sp. 'monogermtubi']|nr:hypothetical protein LZ554_006872 [Drepanopeziza brunnea f. sp. 'monogermtubi']
MTRPQIIRADSIDLQDQNSPSAQDHTRQPTSPGALGVGPPAPHQAEALREVAVEAAEENHRSPRVSKEWSKGDVHQAQQYGDELAARVTSNLTGTNLQQQDDLAIAQNGGSTSEDADMADAEGDDLMDDDMMDKISSSPSIDDEDIDFEFVYALHTFVATVEGQANATKGDTMVLLDDSNSYWWLVRVVKDSSIGYLPAEHIETPTERLARLNKHRNIDLTSAMLGDQEAKPKNPLKKAIRRRNAKTVTFAAPTYVEASDVDYSTDEEDGEGDYYGQNGQQDQNVEHQDQETVEEEIKVAEPLDARPDIREVGSESAEPDVDKDSASKPSSDITRSSDEIFDGKLESKSRNGTLRNTDSFFKDDSVETRKITLTPNLLRDDSSSSTRTSNESKEQKQRPSLDKLEKDSPEKSKDRKEKKDKKEKEKKPGMLSGLFKRKEKKSKISIDEEIEELSEKRENDNQRASPSPSKESEENSLTEAVVVSQTLERQASKQQKPPRTESAPIQKGAQSRQPIVAEPVQAPAPERAPPAESAPAPSMRIVKSEPSSEDLSQQRIVSPVLTKAQQPQGASPEATPSRNTSEAGMGQAIPASQKEQKAGGKISKILRSANSSNSEPRPVKAKKAKSRVELDDFDSSSEDSLVEEPARGPSKQSQRPVPGSFPDSYISTTATERSTFADERLSESPVQASPGISSGSYPPALMVDSSSQEDQPSPVSSPSPDLIDADDVREKKGTGSSTTSTSTATWSDAHLRTFFDDDADIKDLLVVVYDKSGVVPAGPDHPIMGSLFKEENAKLADITNRLDGMLGDWLARKMRTQSSR